MCLRLASYQSAGCKQGNFVRKGVWAFHFRFQKPFIEILIMNKEYCKHMKIEKLQALESLHSAMPLAIKAFEEGLSAYDATYLLLAQKLGCPLATLDKDLRRAAKHCGVEIAGDLVNHPDSSN